MYNRLREVNSIKITLDDDVPEFMKGIIRIGSVIAEDEDGNKIQDHQELVNNTEFNLRSKMITYIANNLSLSEDVIRIED